MSSNKIVVLGAGVNGLTSAYLLSQNPSNTVTLVAKHMPGDYDAEYCSPWAGANYMPTGKDGSLQAQWERTTWPKLKELTEKSPEAGIHFLPTTVYNRLKDHDSATGQWCASLVEADPWFKDIVDDFRTVPASELPPGYDNATQFTSVCINTAIYLPWLLSQCRKSGVVLKRATFKHVADAASAHHSGEKADVVVNCTGLSSRTLGGVQDKKLYPVRGQIVLLRNDPGQMSTVSGTDDGHDETTFIMPRAAGGGTVISGSYQKNNWDASPDPNLAIRIMKRAVALQPKFVSPGQGIEGLDVVRHGVGLRPARDGGPRVARDVVEGVNVVHNYGHGGFGYRTSWGCTETVVQLVDEVLNRAKAKL